MNNISTSNVTKWYLVGKKDLPFASEVSNILTILNSDHNVMNSYVYNPI